MTATTWPFDVDADKDDPLTACRIAVTSSHPRWCYIVGFDRESPARPTEAEAAMLASFLREYIDHWYTGSYKAKLAERPLDVDGGANGIIFRKYGDGDWAYRRRTWTSGPMFVPEPPRLRGTYPTERQLGPLSLARLMDRIHTIGEDQPMQRWLDWKAQHPEVFDCTCPTCGGTGDCHQIGCQRGEL